MNLGKLYDACVHCLNAQAWDDLGNYVTDDVTHNQNRPELSGYRKMLAST